MNKFCGFDKNKYLPWPWVYIAYISYTYNDYNVKYIGGAPDFEAVI